MNKTVRTSIYFLIVVAILDFILYPKFKPEESGPQVQEAASLRRTIIPLEARLATPTRIENIIKILVPFLPMNPLACAVRYQAKLKKFISRKVSV